MLSILPFVKKAALREYRQALPRIRREEVAQIDWNSHNGTFGVAGNTFRAYTGWQSSPSKVFREWAEQHATSMVLRTEARSIRSQDNFERLHQRLSRSLQRAWRAAQGRELTVAHKYKLIDLYIKWLTRHRLPDADLNNALLRFGHCALDRQTLAKINSHLNGALPIAKATMGVIAAEATYSLCQSVVREYCAIAGGSPVLFDYFAWQSGG